MTRIARIAIPEVVHHITQRGNNRQDVFFVEDERRVYLKGLAEESDRHALTVLGYLCPPKTPSGRNRVAESSVLAS